jgi:hypothetical protein
MRTKEPLPYSRYSISHINNTTTQFSLAETSQTLCTATGTLVRGKGEGEITVN